ncbi:hypothetical protein Hanom_Chr15g01338231 [Helianthus anomalus]
MPQITHLEFICRVQNLLPMVEMFNVFYYVFVTAGFYSFNSSTGNVLPCSKDPPKSLHDWKHKFISICRGVIPIDMHFQRPNEKVPKEPVIEFADQQWYKTFVGRPTPMLQLDETSFVAAGMSMLSAPKNPRHAPTYGYKGESYGLMNALNPKVCGEMVAMIQPEGELPWLEQIKGYFHHPTEESLAAYTPARTGANPPVFARPKISCPPQGRRLFSSQVRSPLLHLMSLCIDHAQSMQVLTLTMRAEEEPDEDQVTITQIMEKKRKELADAKGKLDTEATLNISEKKRRLMSQLEGLAPSESEVNLYIFTWKKSTNKLEVMFAALAGKKGSATSSAQRPQKITIRCPKATVSDILMIHGPESPPVGKGLENAPETAHAAKVTNRTLPGLNICEKVDGLETNVEYSETTPHPRVTKFTRRAPFAGDMEGRGHSGEQGGSGAVRKKAGESWMEHIPTYDKLPHVSNWSLVQGSRMDDCHEFYLMSMPPAERLYQKRREHWRLFDAHVHHAVNMLSTTQEIVREWKCMGEQIVEFEEPIRGANEPSYASSAKKSLNESSLNELEPEPKNKLV